MFLLIQWLSNWPGRATIRDDHKDYCPRNEYPPTLQCHEVFQMTHTLRGVVGHDQSAGRAKARDQPAQLVQTGLSLPCSHVALLPHGPMPAYPSVTCGELQQFSGIRP